MHRRTLLLIGIIPLVVLASPAVPGSEIIVVGGSAEQQWQIEAAAEAFRNIGLRLPDLEIGFAGDKSACSGHMGLFDTARLPWRITICSEAEFVYLHELAHAWELAHLTDDERAAFMEFRGRESWADPSFEWERRGVEDAAFIIQQGLMDRPLPPTLSVEQTSRLAAFELLTGVVSPRMQPGSSGA